MRLWWQRRKLAKASVRYRLSAAGSPRKCGRCVMFRRPASCTLVAGRIRPQDTCDRFEAR